MKIEPVKAQQFRKQVTSGDLDSLKTWPAEALNARDEKTGRTLLITAAIVGDKHAMETLLAIPGVDPNISDNAGYTPLIHAIQIHNKGVVFALLKNNNLDTKIEDNQGWSASDHATHLGWSEISEKIEKKPLKEDVSSQAQEEGNSSKKLKLTVAPPFEKKPQQLIMSS